MNITIEQLKRQLNIESDWVEDDAYLQQLLEVSIQASENYLGADALTGYTNTTTPISIEQAVLMIASHFYVTRTPVSFAKGQSVPFTYEFLLNPYKDFVVE